VNTWLSEEAASRTVNASSFLYYQILRFVREWSSLTAMKQRVLRKSGQLFCSPLLASEEITKQQAKENNTRR
jgi:hypothetical protein